MDSTIVLQPNRPYGDLIKLACESGSYNHARAAFAYVTRSGVRALNEVLATVRSGAIPKHWDWLSSVDWCRSDPDALAAIDDRADQTVRIHDGRFVVTRLRCTPRVPFHPKGLLLTGPRGAALLLGSGNLSGNGLQRGHEWGTLLVWDRIRPSRHPQVKAVLTHFNSLWGSATAFTDIATEYTTIYERAATEQTLPVPTDDDAVESERRGISNEDLASLRAAKRFWIRFLRNPNLGAGKAGSQLTMSRNMRVFFGFPARDLRIDSTIGAVEMVSGQFNWPSQTLRFSNNQMDVLNLPIPGSSGMPTTYDNKLIEFRRLAHLQFELRVHSDAGSTTLRKVAGSEGMIRHMKSGRPWGWA